MPSLEELESDVLASPAKLGPVSTYVDALEAAGANAPEVDAALVALQHRHQDPLPALLVRVLRGPGAADNRAHLQQHLDRFLESPQARTLRTVWEAFVRLRPLPAKEAERCAKMRFTVVQLFFMAQPPAVRSLADVEAGGVAGLSAEQGETVLAAAEHLRPDPTDLLVDVQLPPSERIRDHVERRYRNIAWQDRALADRCLSLLDPWTGRAVRPFDTVVTYGRSAYSFGDAELSVLVTGDSGNQVLGLLLPRVNVMVDLGSTAPKYINDRSTAHTLAHLVVRAAANAEGYEKALAADRAPVPASTVTALWGTMQNYAHHVWNYHSAFERLLERGLLGNIDELYFTGTEFFGPVTTAFPELRGCRLVRDEYDGVRDPHPFSPDHLVIQPGSYLVLRGATERIIRAMHEMPAAQDVADPPPPPRPFPVLWVGLRVGSRVWVDQEHEIPALVERVHERYPDLLVVLDGFTFPVGEDTASAKWNDAIEELNRIAETIRSRCPEPDRVVNLVRTTLREAILWAQATDVYLAPLGTAQHKVAWFGDAVGAIYTAASVAEEDPELRIGAWEAEGRPVPRYVFGRTDAAGERFGRFDVRNHLDNIRLDLDEVTEVVLDLLSTRTR